MPVGGHSRRMYRRRVFTLFCLSAVLMAAGGTPWVAAPQFAGLWRAERRFGPDMRGPLVIRREGASWAADFHGRTIDVSFSAPALSFKLDGGEGSFSGTLSSDGSRISGHWIPPHSVLNGFQFATPVSLHTVGPNRWDGEVNPYEDTSTLFLPISVRGNGSTGAYLRNPDRNFGTQYDVDRIVRDGNDVALIGKRNGAGAERVLATGEYHPDAQILSLFLPERGGTYDFQRDDDPGSRFYPRGKAPAPYVYQPPLSIDDGWKTGTLAAAGIDTRAIERFVNYLSAMPMESLHTPQVDAVLIARHGKLVFEEYFHGFDRTHLHDTRSAAKSITATVVGAAMQAGVPVALTSHVYAVMGGDAPSADLDARKRAMTLEDLLMMRSGYYCDDHDPAAPGNEETMLDQNAQPDYYRYVLGVPMAFAPDTHSVYCSTNPNLALGVVGRAAKEDPMDLFDRLVGAPLQITHYAWPLDGVGHPYGGGSVQIRPRDFLKIGQLMLGRGLWNGHRVLPAGFAQRACSPLHDLNRIQYGYLWWSIVFPYKNRTVRACFAGGNGGQGVFVVPELDLVIGIFASNYGDNVGLHVQQDLPANYIIPAVREKGDDPNAPVPIGTFKTPYGYKPTGPGR